LGLHKILARAKTKEICKSFGSGATALKDIEKRFLANTGCSAKTKKTYFSYGFYLIYGETE